MEIILTEVVPKRILLHKCFKNVNWVITEGGRMQCYSSTLCKFRGMLSESNVGLNSFAEETWKNNPNIIRW